MADVTVRLLGDVKNLERKFDGLATSLEKTGARLRGVGKTLTKNLTLPITAALGLATKAAADEGQEMAVLEKALKNTVGASDDVVGSVEKQITAWQNATGIADGKLRPAYGNLIRAHKDVGKANRDMAIAMDVSVAKGLDLESVTKALGKAAGGNTAALSKLGIKTKDASGEALTYDEILAELSKTMGGSAAAAADTAAGRTAILKAKMADLTEQIGSLLLPILDKVTGFLSKVAEKFGNLSPKVQTMIVVGLGLLAALGPLVTVIGTLVTVVGFLVSPVGLVVLAIAALGAGFVYAYKHSETFRKIVDGVVAWFRDTAAPAIATFGQGIVDKFNEVKRWVEEIWPDIKKIIEDAINAVKAVVEPVVAGILDFWSRSHDEIKAVAERVWDAIKGVIEGVVDVIRGVIDVIVGVLSGDWSRAWDGLKSIFDGIWGAITSTIGNLPGILGEVITLAKDALIAAGKQAGLWLGNGIKDGLKDSLTPEGGGGVVDIIKDTLKGFDLGGLFKSIPNPFKPFIPGRAHGGPVSAGRPYWVGEKGMPELFVPDVGGTIVPADRLRASSPVAAAGGSPTINITVEGSVVTERELVEVIREGIRSAERALS